MTFEIIFNTSKDTQKLIFFAFIRKSSRRAAREWSSIITDFIIANI